LNEKDTHYWSEVARRWQEAHPTTLWRAYNDSINTSLFTNWLPSGKVDNLLKTDLFDESLGEGLYSLLVARAKNVFGIDVSTLTTQVAKQRHNGLQLAAADVRYLPFSDGTFDSIVSNSTLDHFESKDEISTGLRELHRVLRFDGQLLLTLDNLANPVIGLRNLLPFSILNRLNIVPYYVGTTFRPQQLCECLRQSGFEVLDVQTIMHFPRILTMLMTRALEKLAGQRIKNSFLSFLMSFEHLSQWPTRFLTGYYIAVKAIKKSERLK
jgi:ubiquinone/menaquinone biosynthesis C-methylase UbiE